MPLTSGVLHELSPQAHQAQRIAERQHTGDNGGRPRANGQARRHVRPCVLPNQRASHGHAGNQETKLYGHRRLQRLCGVERERIDAEHVAGFGQRLRNRRVIGQRMQHARALAALPGKHEQDAHAASLHGFATRRGPWSVLSSVSCGDASQSRNAKPPQPVSICKSTRHAVSLNRRTS
ncbi:hypothetical protein DL770_011280 [Monosporascus sp. CRB-9-2]|nr:hypothetical protein DL770_011280 [Monosporascus sp. CRB-9-2]